MKLKVLAILLFLQSFTVAGQQAWTRAKGKFYSQIGVSYLAYDALIDKSGENIPLNREVNDVTVQAYGEYGFTDRLTASANIPLKVVSVKNTIPQTAIEGNQIGLSNLQVALSYQILQKNDWVCTARTSLALPTASNNQQTGLRTGFSTTTFAPSVAVGYGHAKFFSSAEIGYALRTNDYSNRRLVSWQIGKFFGKKQRLIAILGLDMAQSEADGIVDDGLASTTGLYLDEQSYLSPVLKAGYKLGPNTMIWASMGASVGNITTAIGASPGLSFSVSYAN